MRTRELAADQVGLDQPRLHNRLRARKWHPFGTPSRAGEVQERGRVALLRLGLAVRLAAERLRECLPPRLVARLDALVAALPEQSAAVSSKTSSRTHLIFCTGAFVRTRFAFGFSTTTPVSTSSARFSALRARLSSFFFSWSLSRSVARRVGASKTEAAGASSPTAASGVSVDAAGTDGRLVSSVESSSVACGKRVSDGVPLRAELGEAHLLALLRAFLGRWEVGSSRVNVIGFGRAHVVEAGLEMQYGGSASELSKNRGALDLGVNRSPRRTYRDGVKDLNSSRGQCTWEHAQRLQIGDGLRDNEMILKPTGQRAAAQRRTFRLPPWDSRQPQAACARLPWQAIQHHRRRVERTPARSTCEHDGVSIESQSRWSWTTDCV